MRAAGGERHPPTNPTKSNPPVHLNAPHEDQRTPAEWCKTHPSHHRANHGITHSPVGPSWTGGGELSRMGRRRAAVAPATTSSGCISSPLSLSLRISHREKPRSSKKSLIALIPAVLAQPVPLRCHLDPDNPRACEPRPASAMHRKASTPSPLCLFGPVTVNGRCGLGAMLFW